MYSQNQKLYLLRYVVYAVLLYFVFFFRDFTPTNELKYVSIVDEALRNGTWFTFYNHGDIYADKPPLFFWIMMFLRMLTGGYYLEIIGVFSLLPTIGVLMIMDKWMKMQHTVHRPIVSELLLLTTAMFLGAALIIRMDMLMTFFIVLSLYTFFHIYESKHAHYEKYMLPVYIFLAVFSKGPMGLLIPVVSIVAFLIVKGKFKTIGHYLGWKQWGIMFCLFALWFACVYLEGGHAYLENLVFRQTVSRGIDSFHHKEPFWFYFQRMLATLAPWSLLYIVLIGQGIKKHVVKGDLRLFFAVIIVANVSMLSLISAKLDIYMLPIYPFVIYLCSSLLPHFEKTKITQITVLIPAVLAVLALPVSFFVISKIPYNYENLFVVRFGLSILCLAGLVALIMLKYKYVQRAIVSISAGILGLIFVASFALPQFNKDLGLGEMAEAAKTQDASQYAYYKFGVASNMDAYVGEKLIQVDSLNELDTLMRENNKTVLFVKIAHLSKDSAFAQRLETSQSVWDNGKYRCYILHRKTMTPSMFYARESHK